MRAPISRVVTLLLLSLLIPAGIQAGETGKITGTVVDKETGNPLPGVNVIIEGTSMGAATDSKGEFFILFVSPGLYDVRFSFIGYSDVTITNVRVTKDLTTNMRTIAMEPEAIRGEAVTVVAEKPLIEINATNEVRVIRSEDIRNLPVRGYRNIAALQTGVVDDGTNLHVRGGRTDEVGYYIDGILVNNPYTLGRSGDVPNLSLEEVSFQAGGFGAEYGSANSGIINTTTRVGGSSLQFMAEGITDGFLPSDPTVASKKPYAYSYGYNLFSASLGGPIPLANFIRFFGAIEYQKMADRDPSSGVFGKYVGPLNPANGLPDNGESFTDNNGNTLWDDGEPFVDEDGDGEYDAPSYLNIDPNDIEFVYGPKPNNWRDRLSASGNVLVELKPLTGLAWKLKAGGTYFDSEQSNYTHSYSLFNFYNTASTAEGIGTDGKLRNRFQIQTNKTNTVYGRLSGVVPGFDKMFFSAQFSHFNEEYRLFDPVHKMGWGTYRYEDGTVSEDKIPYLQIGKREDFANPTWVYIDSSTMEISRLNYWTDDSTLSFVQIDYDTSWINPMFSDVGTRPITYVELANYYTAGRLTPEYRKRSTERNALVASVTWQVGKHEIKFGGSYEKSAIRYYRMGRATSLSRYFDKNRMYSPTQDRYTYVDSLNNIVASDGDGVSDYLQDPDDTWDNTDEDGNNQVTYEDYRENYVFQAFKSAYAENIGYNITGTKEVDTGLDRARTPIIGAFYFQDKRELKDLILNLGIRYDYIDPANRVFNPEAGGNQNIVITSGGTLADTVYALDENADGILDPMEYISDKPTTDDPDGVPQMVKAKVRSLWSPRIGLAFPVTDRTVFHAQYGKYFQLPELNRLFISYTRFLSNLEQGNYTTSANPELQPVKTTSYEIGFKQLITKDVSIDATLFYRQMSGYVQIRNVAARPVGYALFVNGDYGTVRGLSFSANTRRLRNIQITANYTLQWAGGTGSTSDGLYRIAWQGGNNPTFVSPLDYDQRHTGSVSIDYRTGSRNRIPLFGANILFQFGSGMRYTPAQPRTTIFAGGISDRPTAGLNTGTMPWTFNLDLKFDKTFKIAKTNLNFFLWVLNALDQENVYGVYTGTGLPDNDGWLGIAEGQNWLNSTALGGPDLGAQLYQSRLATPGNFGNPRQIRLGIRIDL